MPRNGNATQNFKPYFGTSKDVFQKAREKRVNGLNVKIVYDEVNKELSGVYYPSSKSSELRETPTKRKGKKEQRNEHTGIVRRIIDGINAAAF